jgi:DNA integrity scanning protein DisA with diadenylate cyclase activity
MRRALDGDHTRTQKEILETFFVSRDFVPDKTVIETLELAIEIAREGREGRKIGALFVIGDTRNVIRKSRPLILDPLSGHPKKKKHITLPGMRETLKELAQLDGGFVISKDGYALSATRFFNTTIEGLNILPGLGTRHLAAASITRKTRATAVAVSESSIVRLFKNGELIAEILPELYLLSRFSSHVKSPTLSQHSPHNMAIVSSRRRGKKKR